MKYLFIALVFFSSAMTLNANSDNDAPQNIDFYAVAMAGSELDADKAVKLEATVTKTPDDLTARTSLLGYYFMSRHKSSKTKAAQQKHVIWIIENRPEAEIAGTPYCEIDAITNAKGYREAKKLWLKQARANPKSALIRGHASNFLALRDRALAEGLLKEAQQLEPSEPKWSDNLGHLYLLHEDPTKSLAEFEKAQSADDSEESKFVRLDSLAESALDAGDIDKASRYATELLESARKYSKSWNYGNAVHHGNSVLGQISLKNGDVKQAKEFLLKAAETSGSPQLNSFGPNMSLAKALLAAGEKEIVLQYFKLCRKFWTSGAEQLDHWTNDVKTGRVPDFGANLDY